MALKLFRSLSLRTCWRPLTNNNGLFSIGSCNNSHLSPINVLQSRRFQYSEVRNETLVHLPADKPEDKQKMIQSENKNSDSDRIQCLRFERLKEDKFAKIYRKRIKESIEDKQEETDFDLDKVILKTVEDVCGTSDKVVFKCDKCKNVFRFKAHLINHQKSICTGLKSEYRFKKKCDKCLESISVSKFSYHYSICTGVKKTGFKKARENCPDCGLEMNASNIRNHKKKCKGRSRLAEGDVKCPDCGEVFKNKGNLSNHIKSCTGLQANDPTKKVCDKCLKEFSKIGGSFAKHYKTCKGMVDQSNKVNCPDCDKELNKDNLKRHKRFSCHGKQLTKDEIEKESDLLTNIIIKEVEENYYVNNKIEDNSKMKNFDDKIVDVRSRLARFIQLALIIPEYRIRKLQRVKLQSK